VSALLWPRMGSPHEPHGASIPVPPVVAPCSACLSVFSEFERSMIRDRVMAVPTWTQGEVIASLDTIRADLRVRLRAELAGE
jgi:hypothetical protein